MIEYKKVKKSYQNKVIIQDLNLVINDGEFICIIGPSGCGKTTTLKMINRLNNIDSGEILIDGKNINKIDKVELRRSIGYVIQQIGLFPNMNVEENISVVPKLLKWNKESIKKRVVELLELVQMPHEKYANKYPHELSGGEQQRIGVLRALAAKPPIILMDEPFGALDPLTREILQDELKSLHEKLGLTILFVTHDMDEAVKMADRIVFMDKGKVLQCDNPEEMLNNPKSPIIREFLCKASSVNNANDLTCADIMRKNVSTLHFNRKTLESIELMSRREFSSMIVIDEHNKFYGTINIDTLKNKGVAGVVIKELVDKDAKFLHISTKAKDAYEEFIHHPSEFFAVLNDDMSVAGMITKTTIAKSLANFIWGNYD